MPVSQPAREPTLIPGDTDQTEHWHSEREKPSHSEKPSYRRWADSPLKFKHLIALRAVNEEGSFRGAADRLGYVQSAVSHQILALERSVGARLVNRERGGRVVSLTPAGGILIEHAELLFARLDGTQHRLQAIAEGRVGVLRIGAFHSPALSIVPRAKQAFARKLPGFTIEVLESPTDERHYALLRDGQLDLMFCGETMASRALERVHVTADPFVLVVPQGSELAARDRPPSLKEIASMPLIGFNDTRSQDAMLALLGAQGVHVEFAVLVDLNSTVAPMVAAGLGVALVPFLAAEPVHPGTTVIELPQIPPRQISLAWTRKRGLSSAASLFVETAREVAPRFRVAHPLSIAHPEGAGAQTVCAAPSSLVA